MGRLSFEKSVDEIEAPVLMPEEWYPFEVIDDPEVTPNVAMQDDPGSDKAGYNWVVRLRSISEEPEYNGRRFTLWLGLPKEGDGAKYDNRGQKLEDVKMQRIVGFVEAFGGSIDGKDVELGKGAKGMAYVLQQINRNSGEPENVIDIFNAGFKKFEGEGEVF